MSGDGYFPGGITGDVLPDFERFCLRINVCIIETQRFGIVLAVKCHTLKEKFGYAVLRFIALCMMMTVKGQKKIAFAGGKIIGMQDAFAVNEDTGGFVFSCRKHVDKRLLNIGAFIRRADEEFQTGKGRTITGNDFVLKEIGMREKDDIAFIRFGKFADYKIGLIGPQMTVCVIAEEAFCVDGKITDVVLYIFYYKALPSSEYSA